MKFTGVAVSIALAGLVSAAALPPIPGSNAVGGLENTAGMKRGAGDAVSGLTYGVSSSLNGVTGIAGSVAGTGESTTAGAVGTVEKGVAGALPGAKRQLGPAEGVVGGATGATEGLLAAAGGAVGVKRDGADALSGAVYGTTSSLNGVTGIAGSVAGTAESTTAGAVGTVEKGVAGVLPAKRQLGGVGNIVDASLVNDFSMLTGNPAGLIGALGGVQAALASNKITSGQIATIPAELQHVVAFIYTP
ncbi:hypothetical protein N7540_012789 [Penicillium herquei]|nr:hypothetical protein N7540_012789 [Penicillium herquei]